MTKQELILAITKAIVENTEGKITATVLSDLLQKIVTNLSNGTEVAAAITSALEDYPTSREVSEAIATAVNSAKTYTDNAVSSKVTGDGVTGVVALTQAEYDEMEEHVATVLYIIIPESEEA